MILLKAAETFIVLIIACSTVLAGNIIGRNSLERIVDGDAAEDGQFPYYANVKTKHSYNEGGAIISEWWILTAATCVDDVPAENIWVGVGHCFLPNEVVYTVSQSVVHERYNSPQYANNIALLRLAKSLEFDDYIKPIKSALSEGTSCVVFGFGVSTLTDGKPLILQYLYEDLVDTKKCKNDWIILKEIIHDTNACALNGTGKGACYDDLGDPLVCNGELYGILSFFIPCGRGFPDVYTSVYKYRK